MKQRFRCHCGNCDSICTISFQSTEDVVQPLFCPFCGESFDVGEGHDWPDDKEGE